MYSLTPPDRLRGSALSQEAQQTLASWGITGVSFKITGNRATFVYAGISETCMVWDFIQRLNELALRVT